jgi:DNA-binding NtrC family response regulator
VSIGSPPTLVIGQSRFITKFVTDVARMSGCHGMVISGPRGSGKSLLARYVHEAGPRSGERLVIWTPPRKEEAGPVDPGSGRPLGRVFRELGRGTLIIEDVDRLARADQWVLLRYLDWGQVADVQPPAEGLDVRVVATTRRAIDPARPPAGLLPGFWYGFPHIVRIPALSERPEDTELIARACTEAAGQELGKENLHLTPEGLGILKRCSWRGNVRQLKEVMKFACGRSKGAWVDLGDLAKVFGDDEGV